MRTLIIFTFLVFFSESAFALNFKKDSIKIKNLGLAFNSFNKKAAFVGIEYNSKNKPKNIYGIGAGVGMSLYYFRKVPKIQRNLLVGLPFRLYSKNTYLNGLNDNRENKLLFEISPQIAFQFEIGKLKFLKLRINYAPIDIIRIKSLSSNNYFKYSYNKIGIGIVLNFL